MLIVVALLLSFLTYAETQQESKTSGPVISRELIIAGGLIATPSLAYNRKSTKDVFGDILNEIFENEESKGKVPYAVRKYKILDEKAAKIEFDLMVNKESTSSSKTHQKKMQLRQYQNRMKGLYPKALKQVAQHYSKELTKTTKKFRMNRYATISALVTAYLLAEQYIYYGKEQTISETAYPGYGLIELKNELLDLIDEI